MMWVSTASRRVRKPASSGCSQTGFSQVISGSAAPDVVDQHVEPALLGVDPGDQVADLLGHQVVDPDRDAGAAGRGDQLGGLLDGLRPVHLGAAGPAAAPGGVDGGAGRAELHGDLPTGAPGRPGDQRDLSCQRCVSCLRRCQ